MNAGKRKKSLSCFVLCSLLAVLLAGCSGNPLTGKKTMALVGNSQLFPMAFAQYDEFLSENTVITGTAESEMVERVGARLAEAAQKWLVSMGYPNYLDDYQWEYKLVQNDEINAWCMPGGKIAVYTGILPVSQTEDGLAVVLGHEISHALLNHGQQRMSANILQRVGSFVLSIGLQLAGVPPETQDLARIVYGVGSTLGGTLPFSRSNESEADQYGLIIMTIAGYDPDEAVPFWERMAAESGGKMEFLSTHPSDARRINQLRNWTPEAKQIAGEAL